MAGKTVKNMNSFQRNWHSLSGKTFRTIILLSLLISAAAIAFGYFLYQSSVSMDQYTQAWQSANTAAASADRQRMKTLSDTVAFMYERTDERGIEPLTNDGDINGDYAGYFKKYERLDALKKERKVLTAMSDKLGTDSLSYVLIDKEKSRIVYLADSDKSENEREIGYWRTASKEEMKALTEGTDPGWLAEMLGRGRKETVFNNDFNGTYSSAQKISENDRYICAAYAVYDTTRTNEVGRQFLIQYIVLMLFCMLVISAVAALIFRRRISRPVSSMTAAAEAYTVAAKKTDFFSKLNISTGDEIEGLSLALKKMEQGSSEQINEMRTATAEKEREAVQQEMASSIRDSGLPDLNEVLADITEAEVSAYMQPLKENGGDFYDCFRLDQRHIGLLIADVSGGGVTAAVNSVKYEIMLKLIASKGKNSPAEIFDELNWRLAGESEGDITVAVWLGILELDTGILKAANAGHEQPVIRKGDESWVELDNEKQGAPLGLSKESTYSEYEIELEEGDYVFLCSDGVTGAAGEENERFGTKRLLEALNADLVVKEPLENENMSLEIPGADVVAEEESLKNDDPETDAEMLMERIARSIKGHLGGSPQKDDITMICLKYLGGTDGPGTVYEPNMFSGVSEAETGSRIKVAAGKENFRTVFHFIERHLMQAECPFRIQKQILVAAEEIYANIASYAYAPDTGSVDIDIRITEDGTKAKIMFIDSGVEFDPLMKEDSASDGLGIFMVKNIMDDLSYERRDGKNIFTMEKRIHEKDEEEDA